MRNNHPSIKKYTFSTVLNDEDYKTFEEVRKQLDISKSELLRRAGRYYSKIKKSVNAKEVATKDADLDAYQQAPRGAKVPKIAATFQLRPSICSEFKRWCDTQDPSWNYGYAVEKAMLQLMKEDD